MNTQFSKVLCRSVLAAAILLGALQASAQEVIWGSSSAGGTNPGSIFTIDDTTGVATLVGPTGLPGAPRVSALAFDPADGTLYGIAGSACSGARLITIDQITGAGTVVGILTGSGFDGTSTTRCDGGSDALVFGPDGTLYAGGWNGGTLFGKLLVVDKTTGTVTDNFPTSIDPSTLEESHIAGLATAPDGTIWVSRGSNTAGKIHTIDPTNGVLLSTLTTVPSRVLSDLAFSSNGTLYASISNTGQLATVDTISGVVTPIGLFGGSEKISGLAIRPTIDIPPLDCLDGCETIPGQTLTFPPGTDVTGGTFTVTTFRFTDPPGRCGFKQLILFGPDDSGNNSTTEFLPPFNAVVDDDLIIPPYLCGSDDLLVTKTVATGIVFGEGTTLVVEDTAAILPGNFANACDVPVTDVDDLDNQAVIVWQTDDPVGMLEDSSGIAESEDAILVGATGEFTDGCGFSSRGRIRSRSYHTIGLHIDLSAYSSDVFDSYVFLTRYKLLLLQAALEDAVDRDAIPRRGDRRSLENMVGNAIRQLDRGNYNAALRLVRNFLRFTERTVFVGDDNDLGEFQMRGSNIEFMLAEKLIPFAP